MSYILIVYWWGFSSAQMQVVERDIRSLDRCNVTAAEIMQKQPEVGSVKTVCVKSVK